MRACLAAALLYTVTATRAVWHAVGVGVQGFAFTPATVVAAVNDALHLIVPDPNITVIQSAGLDAPCTPLPGGFRSVSGLGKIDLTVFDDSPIYAYAAPHCAEGMVFIVNPRTASDLATMQRNARASAAPTIYVGRRPASWPVSSWAVWQARRASCCSVSSFAGDADKVPRRLSIWSRCLRTPSCLPHPSHSGLPRAGTVAGGTSGKETCVWNRRRRTCLQNPSRPVDTVL